GTGLNGIRFLAGGALHVEDCTINNFTGKGIDFEPSGAAELYVKDTIVRNNQVNAVTGGGIFVAPPTGGSARISLDNVRMENNVFGLRVDGATQGTVRDSVASGNSTHGFFAQSTAGGVPFLSLESSVASNNGASGVRAFQSSTTIRISNMIITDNQTGVSNNGAGSAIVSFGNNSVLGNVVDGAPTSTVPQV
ncbi:MAG TPA: right-handed parallel beta-helix repeat-containing protein, partial [Thermoanaerobaculia bacterium]